jgi:hypothetical protein
MHKKCAGAPAQFLQSDNAAKQQYCKGIIIQKDKCGKFLYFHTGYDDNRAKYYTSFEKCV